MERFQVPFGQGTLANNWPIHMKELNLPILKSQLSLPECLTHERPMANQTQCFGDYPLWK